MGIEEGAIVRWSPENIDDIFSEDAAMLIRDQLPLMGVMVLVDGQIGRMKYQQRCGRTEEITVRLSEVQPARVVG